MCYFTKGWSITTSFVSYHTRSFKNFNQWCNQTYLICRRRWRNNTKGDYYWKNYRSVGTSYDWARSKEQNSKPVRPRYVGSTGKERRLRWSLPDICIVNSVYYLVVLDRKMDHIESSISKAYRMWAMCRRAVSSKRGFNTKMASVIRPIMTYANNVWLPSILKRCCVGVHQKVLYGH